MLEQIFQTHHFQNLKNLRRRNGLAESIPVMIQTCQNILNNTLLEMMIAL